MLLSGYLEQLSLQRGESWKRRWFVLTSRALVCYDNYWVSTEHLLINVRYSVVPACNYHSSSITPFHESKVLNESVVYSQF